MWDPRHHHKHRHTCFGHQYQQKTNHTERSTINRTPTQHLHPQVICKRKINLRGAGVLLNSLQGKLIETHHLSLKIFFVFLLHCHRPLFLVFSRKTNQSRIFDLYLLKVKIHWGIVILLVLVWFTQCPFSHLICMLLLFYSYSLVIYLIPDRFIYTSACQVNEWY